MQLEDDFDFKGGPGIITPKDMLELPRASEGHANEAGDLVFVAVGKFSIAERKNHKSLWIVALESKVSSYQIPLPDEADAFWLDNRTIGLVVSPGEDKPQELYAVTINIESQPASLSVDSNRALIGTFPAGAPVSNYRYTLKGQALVFSANVWPDKKLETVKEQDEKWNKRGSSALVYDKLFARHWDTWKGPKAPTLFSVKLGKVDGKWTLGDEFVSILKETKHEVPVEPFGGTDNFDINESYIVYTTKDPDVSPATHTRQNIYIVDIWGKDTPKQLTIGTQGATNNPVFSKLGDKAAWTEMDEDGYESDRAKIVIYDLTKDVRYTLTQAFDRSAMELCFSLDDTRLYFTAKDEAVTKIFSLPIPPTPSESTTHPNFTSEYQTPKYVTKFHAANHIQVLPNDRLLYTQSSYTSPNEVHLRGIGASDVPDDEKITHFSEEGLKGKDLRMPDQIWFEGAEGKRVQGWVHLPPGWKKDDKKKWPAILQIHGGPQGVWDDAWSTRWNAAVWAHQGYIIVQLNITGSVSFGQEFTDAINKDWGGKPFIDLRKGWKYVLDNYPQIDPERTAAAGGSYGGFSINWIQGHPEWEMGFKALFCHDGTFDLHYTVYSTDELYFKNHEFGGNPWDPEVFDAIQRNNPSRLVAKWSTPQLTVHSSKDFRLAETEGISAFHALQQRGIPSRLVIFPDENHMVFKPLNSLKWHYEIFRWWKKWIGAGTIEDKE